MPTVNSPVGTVKSQARGSLGVEDRPGAAEAYPKHSHEAAPTTAWDRHDSKRDAPQLVTTIISSVEGEPGHKRVRCDGKSMPVRSPRASFSKKSTVKEFN